MLREKGAVVIDADEVARAVVEPGSSGWAMLREILPPDFFDPVTKKLNRRKLRLKIVEDKALRKRVEKVLHPEIVATMERLWREAVTSRPEVPVFFDVPLLYEAGMEDRFDRVILVYVDPETQVDRLCRRDGIGRREALRTLKMQLPIEWKRERAHEVIDNTGSVENTRRQVEDLWNRMTRYWAECKEQGRNREQGAAD